MAIEAVLVAPILLILVGMVAQYMTFAQARTTAEQAAYAAARSALVHKCKPANLMALLQSPLSGLGQMQCEDNPEAWRNAARWALIPAAPSSDFAAARGRCPGMDAARQAMQAAGLPQSLDQAFWNRLCYVHEAGNVALEVRWLPDLSTALNADALIPIEARVRFRFPITAPIADWFADGERADGTKWRWGEATVVIS